MLGTGLAVLSLWLCFWLIVFSINSPSEDSKGEINTMPKEKKKDQKALTPCLFGFKLLSCLNYLKHRYKQFNFMCFLSQMVGALRIRHSCHVDTAGLWSRRGWLWTLINCHERSGLLAKGGRENVSLFCMALDSPRVLSPYLRGGWWWFC